MDNVQPYTFNVDEKAKTLTVTINLNAPLRKSASGMSEVLCSSPKGGIGVSTPIGILQLQVGAFRYIPR